jgi:hypothetical protein
MFSVEVTHPRAVATGAFLACFAIIICSHPGPRPILADVDQPPIIVATRLPHAAVQSNVPVAVRADAAAAPTVLASATGGVAPPTIVEPDPPQFHAPTLKAAWTDAIAPVPTETPAPIHLATTSGLANTTTGANSGKGTFVGIWGADKSACSARNKKGFLPTVIDTEGARASDTFCRFKKTRETANGWNFVASCSNARERWTANVRVTVQADRLTWASERGSQSYVRCDQGVVVARAN